MKQLRTVAVFLALVSLLSVSMVVAQPSFEVPITVTDGSNTTTLYLAITPGAVRCIVADPFPPRAELEFPPPPPTGVFDARFLTPAGCGTHQGGPHDYRPYVSAAQIDTFRIRQQLGSGTTMTINWPNLAVYFTSATLRYFDQGGGANVNINMLTSNTADVTAAGDGTNITLFLVGPLSPPDPGPCFQISTNSLGFGNVGVGSSSTLQVTVNNTGFTNPLNISAIVANAPFSILPAAPVVVPPSGSQVFNVTFTPTVAGPVADNISFTHDGIACGVPSPTLLAVSGTGTTQGGTFQFTSNSVLRCDGSNNNEARLMLQDYVGDPLKALQFRVIVPTALLANVGGVTRGANLPSAQWNFSHVITHGPVADTIKVVFFGNGATSLPPGTYNDLVRYSYSVANISGVSAVTSMAIANVLGSTPGGTNAGVTAGPDQIVNIQNSTSKGDVNGDDVIDILDVLLIVDHILNRITLTGDMFLRADIAPWPTGDGSVDVLDLALVQNIILTGGYPGASCTPVGRPMQDPIVISSGNSLGRSSNVDAKLTFYMTQAGIAVRLENAVPVKGIQLEFGSIPSVPASMHVSTLLGQSYHNLVNDVLRVLMYDMQASVLQPGDYLVSNIPFTVTNPRGVTVDNVVIADAQNNRLEDVEIEISYETSPDLPMDYVLFQNFPNPFNPKTQIKFSVPEVSDVKVVIYDMLGQEVLTLFAGQMTRGTKVMEWDGRDLNGSQVPSGMYMYRMTAGRFMESRKMMLLK